MRTADRAILSDFVATVLLGGLTAVGVHTVVKELAPLWAGAMRFAPAALLLFLLALLVRAPMPHGRALVGAILFGALDIGFSTGFLYWGMQAVPASVASITLAFVPLLTFLLAMAHRREAFSWRALIGALLAVAGMAVIFAAPVNEGLPILPVLALLAGVACMAEANVVIKVFPESHPISLNAVAMTSGALILVLLSAFLGETLAMPGQPRTWFWMVYLIVIATCAVFILFIHVLEHWSASAAAYAFVLMSVVGVIAAAILLDEPLTPSFIAGAALVLGGVYLGALAHQPRPQRKAEREPARELPGMRRHC